MNDEIEKWYDSSNNTNREYKPMKNIFVREINKRINKRKIIIEEYENINITKLDDILLLEKCIDLIKDIRYNIFDRYKHSIFYEWINKRLLLVKNMLEILAKNNNQNIKNNKKNNNNILRNSYKFCKHTHNCKFYYNKKSKCYSQHFVYNLVHSDIVNTINYINNQDININEVKISINTINYVLTHMYDELNNIKLYKTN